MRYFHPTIESHMRKTAGRWKFLRMLQHTGTLGMIACAVVGLLGVGMWRGWLQNPYAAGGMIAVLTLGTGLAWLILAIIVFSSMRKSRSWIAGHLEKGYSPLLDRINALVFLDEKKRDPGTQSYISRIEAQASTVLKGARPRNPFPALRPLVHIAAFACMFAGTFYFYSRIHPWQRLMAAWHEHQASVKEKAAEPDFKLPETSVTDEKKSWSEVRITDPASDINATKVDVVPLEIEAASSQSLNKVGWALSVDGGKEQTHPLDAPAEPHYAVYQPVLSLDELQLSDWDVVSYYAKASLEGGDSSSSELYFIEIRPFREDIMKMPGGESGKPMQILGELTSLIDRQRLILRQTHHYDQQPSADSKSKETDRKKLDDAETELGESVTHFYAKLAADYENQPIGDTLEHLAMSGTYIDRAVTELRNDFASQAVPLEQGALTELAATRKNFQKFINEHPDAFKDEDKDSSPVAGTGQTEKIAEFRNAEKAASDFLQKSADKQKNLAARSKGSKPGGYGGLQKEQEDLEKSLSDFESQNPDLFKDLTKQTEAADKAMKKAAEAFKTAEARNKLISAFSGTNAAASPSPNGQNSTSPGAATNSASAKHIDAMQQNAVNSLDDLKNSFANANTRRQIEHAHELKNQLEKEAKELGKAGSEPGAAKPGQLQQTAQGASQTVGQLKDIIDHTGAGKAFGPQLHDALSDAQQSKLSSQLSKLGRSQDAASQKAAAQEAAKSLQNINRAFEESLPATLRQAQQSNPLSPGDQESFDQAMKELESLQAAQQSGHPMSPESEAKQREDARLALIKSIPQLYGRNDATTALLSQIDLDLKDKGKPIDLEALKKLTDQIQNFRTELDDKKMEKPDKAEISHSDPSKLPPEYRERVERYFQKLSEQ